MDEQQMWRRSHRADPVARRLADLHYNRQKIGTRQFVPPGRCFVLVTENEKAFWVTSWPFGEYVKHAWPGAWVCSAFRSEGAGVASALIRAAVAATRANWPDPPAAGMITFVDRKKVRPTMRRGIPTWGFTYLKAGFHPAGETKGGLLAFKMSVEDMPAAIPPRPWRWPIDRRLLFWM